MGLTPAVLFLILAPALLVVQAINPASLGWCTNFGWMLISDGKQG
jgi:hypothetical protein